MDIDRERDWEIEKVCLTCGFHDEDFGCTCFSSDKWYACPLEPEPTEEDFK